MLRRVHLDRLNGVGTFNSRRQHTRLLRCKLGIYQNRLVSYHSGHENGIAERFEVGDLETVDCINGESLHKTGADIHLYNLI